MNRLRTACREVEDYGTFGRLKVSPTNGDDHRLELSASCDCGELQLGTFTAAQLHGFADTIRAAATALELEQAEQPSHGCGRVGSG